jgi:hypothetical protein
MKQTYGKQGEKKIYGVLCTQTEIGDVLSAVRQLDSLHLVLSVRGANKVEPDGDRHWHALRDCRNSCQGTHFPSVARMFDTPEVFPISDVVLQPSHCRRVRSDYDQCHTLSSLAYCG